MIRRLFWALLLVSIVGCTDTPESTMDISKHNPRREGEYPSEIVPSLNGSDISNAKRVFGSLQQIEGTPIWAASEKLEIFGRKFDFWIEQEEGVPNEALEERLAVVLSVADDLVPHISPLLLSYYESEKAFVDETFGRGLAPSGVTEESVWDILDFTVLAFNDEMSELANQFESGTENSSDNIRFYLYGSVPWSEEGGPVVGVREGKIIVTNDQSLYW